MANARKPPSLDADRTPVAQRDGVPGDEATRTLDAWTALEVLSPQAYARSVDLVAGERLRIASFDGKELPWEVGGVGRSKKRLYYQVVLGELQLEPAYAALLENFGDDAPDRAPGKPYGVLAVVVCDKNGVPQPEGIAISSFAWALPIALSGNLGRLKSWRSEEAKLKHELGKRLMGADQGGHVRPLDRNSLAALHDWLVRVLTLDRSFVKPPSFAVREFQPIFVREAPDPLLLNSFYLADLGRARDLLVAGKAPSTLQRYLGTNPPAQARDVLHDPSVLADLLAPARTPPGRWPAPGRFPLVALQQAAVNTAMSSSEGEIVAVNGPPGTGKTTLLRDILAAVVTARAEVLATFDHPAQAFTRTGVTFTRSQATFELRSVAPQLHGFEMVVASSNNKAVENVSADLPSIDRIADDLPNLRYFSSIASAVREKECWGLIAAVLGNASNVYSFQQTFWRDEDRGIESYLATAAGTPRWIAESDGEVRLPQVVEEEDAPSDPAEALGRWRAARQHFLSVLQASRASAARLQRIHELEQEIPQRQHRLGKLVEARTYAERDLLESGDVVKRAQGLEWAAQEALENARGEHQEHATTRPNLFARLFRTLPARLWSEREMALRAKLAEATAAAHSAAESRAQFEGRFERATRTLDEVKSSVLRESELLETAKRNLASATASLRAPSGAQLAASPHAQRHTATAWFDRGAQHLRDDVFVAAMKLHKAFIDAAAEPLRHNLAGLDRHFWTGVPGARPEHVRDLWTSLALVVPLVSTTFASVEKMFGDLPPSSLGWLLLDESGQATPQSAVGAIMRANHVVVVGDPMQVEPVVALPSALTKVICTQIGIDASRYAAPSASTQTLADRASPIVATFEAREGARKVGLPLLVHRRCAEPMFGISNAVAYVNQMVKATPERESPIGEILGPSRWIDVAGTASHHWCAEEGEVLLWMLRKLAEAEVAPELYVITPFRGVAQSARELVRRSRDLSDWLGDAWAFSNERIGTVHTVQGREAEAVIFVLGAPEQRQQGARQWAGMTPNLLNVAVTRAQQRLYVIGNRSVWRSAGCFRLLDERLSTEDLRRVRR